jgi:hypothetical protein
MAEDDPLALALPYKFPLSTLFGTSYARPVTMLNPSAGISIDAKFLESGDYAGIILHDDVKNAIAYDASGLWSQSYGPYTLMRVPTVKQNCG